MISAEFLQGLVAVILGVVAVGAIFHCWLDACVNWLAIDENARPDPEDIWD